MASFVYYRLNITSNNSSSNTAVAEFKAASTIGGGTVFTGGTPTASGDIGYPYWAQFAFDGDANTMWNVGSSVCWLKYQLGSAVEVVQYSVQTRNDGYLNDSPKDWTFEGSNDGSSWYVLDAQVNQTGWSLGEERTFIITFMSESATLTDTLDADIQTIPKGCNEFGEAVIDFTIDEFGEICLGKVDALGAVVYNLLFLDSITESSTLTDNPNAVIIYVVSVAESSTSTDIYTAYWVAAVDIHDINFIADVLDSKRFIAAAVYEIVFPDDSYPLQWQDSCSDSETLTDTVSAVQRAIGNIIDTLTPADVVAGLTSAVCSVIEGASLREVISFPEIIQETIQLVGYFNRTKYLIGIRELNITPTGFFRQQHKLLGVKKINEFLTGYFESVKKIEGERK